jgi:hypothetical protein
MKGALRAVEIRKDKSFELSENMIPVRLEPVIDYMGKTVPEPSSEKFILYYIEKKT